MSGSGKLTLGGGGLDQTTLRSGVSGSRGKNVQVEVRRKRVLNPALRASPPTQPETLVPKEGTIETSVQIDDRLTAAERANSCLLYTSPSPRDKRQSRMPSSA